MHPDSANETLRKQVICAAELHRTPDSASDIWKKIFPPRDFVVKTGSSAFELNADETSSRAGTYRPTQYLSGPVWNSENIEECIARSDHGGNGRRSLSPIITGRQDLPTSLLEDEYIIGYGPTSTVSDYLNEQQKNEENYDRVGGRSGRYNEGFRSLSEWDQTSLNVPLDASNPDSADNNAAAENKSGKSQFYKRVLCVGILLVVLVVVIFIFLGVFRSLNVQTINKFTEDAFKRIHG